MAKFIQPLAHYVRIRIIEELQAVELDVTSLQKKIGIAQSTVSQHLAILKKHHFIKERKEGRRVIYNLIIPELSQWLIAGVELHKQSERMDESLKATQSEDQAVRISDTI